MNVHRTENVLIAAASLFAVGFALGSAMQASAIAAVPEPQPEPAVEQAMRDGAVEHVQVGEPLYVIVAQKPGAPMATGSLAVEAIEIYEPAQIHVFPTPIGALAQVDAR